MNKITASNKIYVSGSKLAKAGRGVFAFKDIKKGEIIETCPAIEVSHHEPSNLEGNVLVTYFFYFGKKKEKIFLSLGFGSIYNHSYSPNAEYRIKPKEKVIEFKAIKNIEKDDEITFNYSSGNPKDGSPLWFEIAKK